MRGQIPNGEVTRRILPVAPSQLTNIGNHQQVKLLYLVELLEEAPGWEARKNFLPMQPDDIEDAFADVTPLQRDVCFAPATPIEQGLARFVVWYRVYYGV